MEEGIYFIGAEKGEFFFDNEGSRHRVFLENYEIANRLVTNGEYIEFIENGGYQNFELWLSEGYDFIRRK